MEAQLIGRKENHARLVQSKESISSKTSTILTERSGLVARRELLSTQLSNLAERVETARKTLSKAERSGKVLAQRETETMERLNVTNERLLSARHDVSLSERAKKFVLNAANLVKVS